MVYEVGDLVYVEKTAEADIGFLAWEYVKSHPRAIVKAHMIPGSSEFRSDVPSREHLYALEWAESFPGGHPCSGYCVDHRGQFVTAKHLSLCFEESQAAQHKEISTVPNIGGYDGEEV